MMSEFITVRFLPESSSTRSGKMSELGSSPALCFLKLPVLGVFLSGRSSSNTQLRLGGKGLRSSGPARAQPTGGHSTAAPCTTAVPSPIGRAGSVPQPMLGQLTSFHNGVSLLYPSPTPCLLAPLLCLLLLWFSRILPCRGPPGLTPCESVLAPQLSVQLRRFQPSLLLFSIFKLNIKLTYK